MRPTGDDLDEPPQQRSDQIRGQRVGGRLAAADDHVGQQRQPQRVAMGELDQLVVTGRVDATGVQVLPAVLRAQVAQRHHPQQLPPGRVGAPGRTRRRPVRRSPSGPWPAAAAAAGCVPSRPAAPAARRCRAGPPAGRRRTAPAMAPSPSGTSSTAPQRLEHGRRRRDEVATVESDDARTGVGGQLGDRRPAGSSCRCLVARARAAPRTAARSSRARPGTARSRMRARRTGAAGETPAGRRASRQTASRP